MSNDQLLDQESNRSGVPTATPKIATNDPSQGRTSWTLSSMLIWTIGIMSCFVVGRLWVDSVSRLPSSSSEVLTLGFVISGLFYFLMFLPLSWLFSVNRVLFVSKMSILLIASFFLFAIVFAPRFFVCLWLSIFLVSLFYVFQIRWPRLRHARVGSVLASISMLLTVGVYSFSMSLWPTFELQKLYEMRATYPISDVSERLSRLRRPNTVPLDLSDEANSMQYTLSMQFMGNLIDDRDSQAIQLRLVHDAQFERFVRAPGFGSSRMNPRIIHYDPQRLVAGDKLRPFDAHTFAYRDFFHRSTLGFVTENSQQYVGFKPHMVFNAPKSVQLSQEYILEKLELVGMLLHETPVVYETDGLPNMETITAGLIPTRELNEFESRSLEKLKSGRSLEIETVGSQLRMLGALRAIDQCVDCHRVEPGQLLGAFSYEYRLKTRRQER